MSAVPTIALLEVLDRDDHVKHYLPIGAWPVTAGRALDNDIVLDDAYIAAHHFRVDADDSGVFVQVGETINGLRADGRPLASGERVNVGDEPLRLEVGDSHLCLRLAHHPLPAEQPLRKPGSFWAAAGPTFAAAVAVLAVLLFTTWLDADPDDATRALGASTLTMLVGAAVWCAGWSLVSKIFTRRSHFWWHVRVMLLGVLAIDLATVVLHLIAFSFSLPVASDFTFVFIYALVAVMLYFHVLGVEPRKPSRIKAAAVGMFVAGTVLSLWFNQQNRDQLGEELYMSHLFPPALRVAKPQDTATFVKGLSTLKPTLDDKARKRDSGDDGESDEE
jgi:hypothetical protein